MRVCACVRAFIPLTWFDDPYHFRESLRRNMTCTHTPICHETVISVY